MSDNFGIHWFRRDLRVAGNQALLQNWKENEGRVVGVFCFDAQFLSRKDFSNNRFQFFIDTLKELKKELCEIGSDLLFMDVGPQEAFPKLFDQLVQKKCKMPSLVTWSQDYEPYSRKRDEELKNYFSKKKIATSVLRDHLLIEPHELSKRGTKDEWYQVYSPFARRWLEVFQDDEIQKRLNKQTAALKYLKNRAKGKVEKTFSLNWKDLLKSTKTYENNLEHYSKVNSKKVTVPIPEAGSLAAYSAMNSFVKRVEDYKDKRDFPSIKGTSQFSLFLKIGSLTVPMIIAHHNLETYKKKKSGQDTFFSELIWREFYYHILYHKPEVENQSFLPQYKDLKWENNKKHFRAWKEGKTGFPIVDAGMRELKETGWMHNRLRMIVASFLTKDLLIDWRWGEKYFMETLLDGDLAPNNGGWQWAASTGCDPQPYFRIFNPWLQGKKFDPDAIYMKKYLPELQELPAKDFHGPLNRPGYPKPIVDHSEQREKALALYKEARANS